MCTRVVTSSYLYSGRKQHEKHSLKNERTKGPRLRQSGWVVTLAVGHLFLIDLKAQVAGCYRMLYVFLVFKEFMSFAILVFWNYSSHHWYKN